MPDFLRDVHQLVAKNVNCSLGRWENLWSTEQTSLVRASSDEDVQERIVYTMANPVTSTLVKDGGSWPGLRLCWPARRSAKKRPKGFFRDDGPTPESATLELSRPPGFEHLDDAELAAHLERVVEEREEKARRDAAAKGRGFLGRHAILRQSPYASPRTHAPHRKISPRVAAKNKWRRIEALQRLADFIRRYRHALHLWRVGITDVEFSGGTYLLRVHAGVRCAET